MSLLWKECKFITRRFIISNLNE